LDTASVSRRIDGRANSAGRCAMTDAAIRTYLAGIRLARSIALPRAP
jgi:hypothetical protein